MLIKKLNRIDENGFYLEDAIAEIPETVEEAKKLGFPVIKRRIPNENPIEIEEPERLGQLRSELEGLRSLPQGEFTNAAIAKLEDEIQIILDAIEQAREDNDFIEIEEFQIPPTPSDLIEELIPQHLGLHRPKWNGSKWIEGLSKKELQERNKKSPDWDNLQNSLRSTDLFAKAMGTSNTNAWALLLTTLAVVRNWDDLKFAIAGVRVGLPEDFTESELQRINQILSDCGFESI